MPWLLAIIVTLFIFIQVLAVIYNAIRYGLKTEDIDTSKNEGFSNETNYNPATGLPMVGGLDINGNSFGSSFSDDWNRSSTSDNSWASSSHSISYDSFNNRYN